MESNLEHIVVKKKVHKRLQIQKSLAFDSRDLYHSCLTITHA